MKRRSAPRTLDNTKAELRAAIRDAAIGQPVVDGVSVSYHS